MLYSAESGDFRIILTGDSIITRKMSVFREPDFLKLVEVLRGSDVTVTNAEILFHNYEDPPTTTSGGTYMRAEPRLIEELRFLGIDMVACANNHAYDFGENGVLTNLRYLDQYGMPHAGTGRDLSEARSPAYLDTPRGRVALISVTSSGPQGMRAGEQWRDGKGRPGANLLRYTTGYTVDRPVFDALAQDEQGAGFRGAEGLSRRQSRVAGADAGRHRYALPSAQSERRVSVHRSQRQSLHAGGDLRDPSLRQRGRS